MVVMFDVDIGDSNGIGEIDKGILLLYNSSDLKPPKTLMGGVSFSHGDGRAGPCIKDLQHIQIIVCIICAYMNVPCQ